MDMLTVNQAAAELCLTRRGVLHRIEAGTMAAERPSPRLLLITRAEVERQRALGPLKRGPKGKTDGPA